MSVGKFIISRYELRLRTDELLLGRKRSQDKCDETHNATVSLMNKLIRNIPKLDLNSMPTKSTSKLYRAFKVKYFFPQWLNIRPNVCNRNWLNK